jgi:hypothetical protein
MNENQLRGLFGEIGKRDKLKIYLLLVQLQ